MTAINFFLKILTRVMLTLAVVFVGFAVLVNTPFFSSNGEMFVPAEAFPPNTVAAVPTNNLGSLNGNLLSGSVFAPDGTGQLDLQEHEVEGPCEGAGLRYKESACSDCLELPGSETLGDQALAMWMPKTDDGSNDRVMTTTADCTQRLANNRVLVSVVSMSARPDVIGGAHLKNTGLLQTLDLPQHFAQRMDMALGGWKVEEYGTALGGNVLEDISRALARKGWREAEGQDADERESQRTFVAASGGFLIVTVVAQDTELSVVTMLNDQEGEAS